MGKEKAQRNMMMLWLVLLPLVQSLVCRCLQFSNVGRYREQTSSSALHAAMAGRSLFKSQFVKGSSATIKPHLAQPSKSLSNGSTRDSVHSKEPFNSRDFSQEASPGKRKSLQPQYINIEKLNIDSIEDLTKPTSPDFTSGFVSIVGNPNVGKSTLLNTILGQKLNIVSSKPQTTRHKVHGILSGPSFQIVFTDTPGMLKPAYKMHETMSDVVHEAVRDADVTLLVTDVFGEELHDEKVFSRLNSSSCPLVIAINKIDLVKSSNEDDSQIQRKSLSSNEDDSQSQRKSLSQIVAYWKTMFPLAEIFEISAAKGIGVAELQQRLISHMQPGPKYFPDDDISDRDERFFTSEIIRETLFELFHEEVPYSCEVVIDKFQDKSPNLSVIDALIVVDKESQKGIVIGTKGTMLKELGSRSRLKLEKFLDRGVFLSLKVVVEENWRANAESLRRFGYIDD